MSADVAEPAVVIQLFEGHKAGVQCLANLATAEVAWLRGATKLRVLRDGRVAVVSADGTARLTSSILKVQWGYSDGAAFLSIPGMPSVWLADARQQAEERYCKFSADETLGGLKLHVAVQKTVVMHEGAQLWWTMVNIQDC